MEIIIAFKHSSKENAKWTVKLSSDLIKWRTNSKYSHVELIIGETWISSQAEEKGASCVPLRPLTDKNYDYFTLFVPDITKEQEELFWKFVKAQEDTGYDWRGILMTWGTFIDNDSLDKWFCSEIATKLLQMLYCEVTLDMRPSRTSPEDLFRALEAQLTKIDI